MHTNFYLCALSTFIVSCGLSLATDKKPKPSSSTTEESPPKESAPSITDRLPIPRQIRRIKIELTGQLPSGLEIEKLSLAPEKINIWTDFLLEQQLSYEIFADNFGYIWNIKNAHLNDLEALIEKDSNLSKELTELTKAHIRHEPISAIKVLFEDNQPLRNLLTFQFSNIHNSLATLYDITNSSTTWQNSPYITFTYPDQRPPAGVLPLNGFLATFPTRGDPSGQHRVHKILSALACDSMSQSKTHVFSDLESVELQGDLTSLSAQKAPCVACHGAFQQIAPAFAGLADGKTWSEWKTYKAPAQVPSGSFGPISFTGLEEFGIKLGSSSLFFRCQIEKLSSLILQMPYNSQLRQSTALSFDDLVYEDQILRKSLKWLLRSRNFNIAPTNVKSSPQPGSEQATQDDKSTSKVDPKDSKNTNDPKDPKATKDPKDPKSQPTAAPISRENQEVSGFRVLRKIHWETILKSLLPQANTFVFSEDLEPTYNDFSDFNDLTMLPNIRYLRAIEDITRKFSYRITREELKDGVNPQDRKLFNELPSGLPLKASPDEIANQIKSLWFKLTSETLENRSQSLLDLYTLWEDAKSQSGKPPNDIEAYYLAWQTIINVILTHPKFYSY